MKEKNDLITYTSIEWIECNILNWISHITWRWWWGWSMSCHCVHESQYHHKRLSLKTFTFIRWKQWFLYICCNNYGKMVLQKLHTFTWDCLQFNWWCLFLFCFWLFKQKSISFVLHFSMNYECVSVSFA